MRIFNACVKILAIVLVFALGNTVLNYVLVPYGSKSEIMWTDYYAQDDIDTIFVGTSITERTIDPSIIDKKWDCTSYNMATPLQQLPESLNAIETAYRDHGITRVVLGIDFDLLDEDAMLSPSNAFLSMKFPHESISEQVADVTEALSYASYWESRDSLNMLCPWIYNHVDPNPSAVIQNVKMRLNGTTLYDAAEANEPGWTYRGKGYGTYSKTPKSLKTTQALYVDKIGRAEFSDEKFACLQDICDFCNQNGIELIAVNLPQTTASVLDYGAEFVEQSSELKAFFASQDIAFYEFNLAKSSLFVAKDEYFSDWQHMNRDGSTAFTKAFANLINKVDAGRDVSDQFCETFDEYCAEIDRIAGVRVEANVTQDVGIELQATALAGSGIEVAYRFSVYDTEKEKWVTLQKYGSSNSCVFEPEERGNYKVRCEVREAGSKGACVKNKTLTVYY